MSSDLANLCSVVMRQCFGTSVQKVADCLFGTNARTFACIVHSTGLGRESVRIALSVMIQFQVVAFVAQQNNEDIPEYMLNREQILYILRYPRYVHLIESKYGSVGSDIVEQLLHAGSQTATNVLVKCLANPDNKNKGEEYRGMLLTLISDNYLIKMPQLVPSDDDEEEEEEEDDEGPEVPKLHIDPYDLFTPPEIDLLLIAQINENKAEMATAKDTDVYWQLNFKRFHQDLRDEIMISAIERKLGPNASECFKYILKLMYERTDPWFKETSNPFTVSEIKQAIEKKSNNLELMKHLDQYIVIIADDSLNFIRKVGDTGGGQYVVQIGRAMEELAMSFVQAVIKERFSSKAARIFRIIRMRNYIEQEELQKEAMIPAKESKLLSYNLFQEQFINIKTIRKAGGGGNGPTKSFYMFYIRQLQLIKMLLNMTYKALFNSIMRSRYERADNDRLMAKSQKLDTIVSTMKARGESDEYIAEILESLTPPEREILDKIKSRIRTLSKSEIILDETIFLLHMYLFHSPPEETVANA